MATQLINTPHETRTAITHAATLAKFRSLVSQSFVPLRITGVHDPAHFNARFASAHADDIMFTEVSANPHLAERDADTIAAGGSGHYKLSLMLSGSSILVQDGREVVMRPGDLTIYDTSRPYSLLFEEEFRNLIMMFPKKRLQLPATLTDQLTAVSLTQEHRTLAPIVASFLTQFPKQLQPCDDTVRTKLASTSLDLVSTMLSSILDTHATDYDPRKLVLKNLVRYIDTHLSSPELTPSSIAAAHYISVRHLHALFREADITVSTWIRTRRLEHCRTDLCNPVFADHTVFAIASRWGFTDAAHFSRIFKTAYAVSPSAMRYPHVASEMPTTW